MRRFISDLKKYWNYISYSTKAELKTEVIDSYLGWLWIILEPFCFMLIYAFIASVVFKAKGEYFPVFIFIGLTIWNFFNKTLLSSVKLVSGNRDIVTKVYVPKFVLLLIKVGVNTFKMFISFIMVAVFMIYYQIPLTWNALWIIPIILTTIVLTFGISCLVMHFGVFIDDLSNIVNIFLRLVFYATGIFYDIGKSLNHKVYAQILLNGNPLANLIFNLRQVLIYQSKLPPEGIYIGVWFFVGILLSIIGIKTIYKYENTYVKVMK